MTISVNARLAEQLSVLATIDPVSQGAGTVTTGWIPAANHERFLALVQTGVMGASGTLDAKLQQAQDSGGTGAKDVTGKALAQIVKASGDNKQAEINLRAEELDLANNFTYFRLSITVGTAASLIAASVLGGVAKNGPASALNQAGVVQNIA
ncbi:MAG: hypothetical protein KGP14_13075 [Betaproteobacteria bacterium]|nr:hypothetical protein [Betaproteobacteria bacterium]